MENAYQSIGLFIDGGYYAKVNEALAAQASLNIDMGSLMYLVRQQVARIGGHALSMMPTTSICSTRSGASRMH